MKVGSSYPNTAASKHTHELVLTLNDGKLEMSHLMSISTLKKQKKDLFQL